MLNGKGMFIHKIARIEGGDPFKIANLAYHAGFSHALIKICDGVWNYNLRQDYSTGTLKWFDDLVGPLVKALKAAGIEAWGWQWVYLGDYGSSPRLEAQRFAERLAKFEMDGAVVNAEHNAKNKLAQTKDYVSEFAVHWPNNIPLALSSYRYPSLHREISWAVWDTIMDFYMPQVYWVKATNPGEQLLRTMYEYTQISEKPIFPTGAAYYEGGWSSTPDQVREFMNTAKVQGLDGFNFWEWYFARNIVNMWDVISAFPWPTQPQLPATWGQEVNQALFELGGYQLPEPPEGV